MEAELVVTAVLDTNVLMRVRLMQFLVGVAMAGAFTPRWSASIREELEVTCGRERPNLLEPLIELADSVPDVLLPVNADDLDLAKGGCDVKDEHVLAAALCAARSGSDGLGATRVLLVTENLKDFDAPYALARGVEVMGVDPFGLVLLEVAPMAVLRTIDRQPPERYNSYLDQMRGDGLLRTANRIEELFAEIG